MGKVLKRILLQFKHKIKATQNMYTMCILYAMFVLNIIVKVNDIDKHI